MAGSLFKWKHPCMSLQRACYFAYRAICRMSLVCCMFRTCLKRICRSLPSVHAFNWNVFTANDSESTYCHNTVESSLLSNNCGSSSMAAADSSVTEQSQVWKRMVSFKRKMIGSSSVLPSVILEMVTTKSQAVLSQQANSVAMPDDCCGMSKCPKLQPLHNISTPDSAVVVISEDSHPRLNASSEDCRVSPESLEFSILPVGDELVALFDSDNQKKHNTPTSAASSGASEFLPVCYCVWGAVMVL